MTVAEDTVTEGNAVALAAPSRLRSRLRIGTWPRSLQAGALLLGASLILAFFPFLFAPYDPIAFDYTAIMAPPTFAHPFGTIISAATSSRG